MKKILAIFLVLTVILSCCAFAFAEGEGGTGEGGTGEGGTGEAGTGEGGTGEAGTGGGGNDEGEDPEHVHSYVSGNVIQPTCTEKGYTVGTCSCGATTRLNEIDPLGHDYVVSITPATYEEEGVKTTTCKRCDYSKTEKVDKLVKVTSITVSPATREVKLNEGPVTLTKTVRPETATNKEVEWRSLNEDVAYVSQLGVVTLLGKGTATIVAIAKDGYGASGSCTLTVTDGSEQPIGNKVRITTEVNIPGAGTVTGGREYNVGDEVTLYVEEMPGFRFSHWQSGSSVAGIGKTLTFQALQSLTVEACFERISSYTIVYKPGTDCPAQQEYTDYSVGTSAYLRGQTYLKSGYTQTGWSTVQGGQKVYDLDKVYPISGNLTLYPFWTKNIGNLKLTVNYSGEGIVYLNGAKVTSGAVYDISELQSYTFTMTPNSKDYYIYSINFAGKYWNANVDTDKFMVTYDMMKAENRTLTIKFDSVTAPPKTGDSSNILLWSCLFGLSAAAVTTGMVLKKKSKS